MELRVYKTETAIRAAFYTLRRKMPTEKIRINELCRLAQINKSTFYRHYKDVFDLSDALEGELLAGVTADFAAADKLYTDPQAFVTGLHSVMQAHREEISLLYNGRMLAFADKIEAWLAGIYLDERSAETEKIKLSFIIGGAIHAFLSPEFAIEETAQTIVELLKKL